MKRVLITGKNSYIGDSLKRWLLREPNFYEVFTVDMRDDLWKEKIHTGYDVVFHVAGIAHRKETRENQNLFMSVNRDLAYETAKFVKEKGIKHFIFLSSMSVYGVENGLINKNTLVQPNSTYGKSKIEAEKLIERLRDENFTLSILRPPMVYGKECRGNYQRLSKLAQNTLFFPRIDNKRSMIYIDCLTEFVKQLIDNCEGGLFFPQNADYVSTSEMVRLIAKAHNRKVYFTKLFNPLIKWLNNSVLRKIFGDLFYDEDMAQMIDIVSFSNSIEETEGAKD